MDNHIAHSRTHSNASISIVGDHGFHCTECGHKGLYSVLEDDACNQCGSEEIAGAQQCVCGDIVVPNGGMSFTQNNGCDVDIETYQCSCGHSWAE